MKSEEASTIAEIGSDAIRPGQESSSVFDFLYHDARRVGSFLSQFEAHGFLQQTRAGESIGRTANRKAGVQGGLEVPFIGKGTATADTTTIDEERDSAEYTYDPLWRNALRLLDFLDERELIQRDVSSARIGQFALVKGRLVLSDISMLKAAWSQSEIKRMVGAQVEEGVNRAERRANKAKKSAPSTADAAMAFMSLLPHTIQARVFFGFSSVWASLSESAIAGLSGDLILKHGALLQGEWSMLGILDALPSYSQRPDDENIMRRAMDDSVGGVAVQVAELAKSTLGRPDGSYGMTPLLIFRDIAQS